MLWDDGLALELKTLRTLRAAPVIPEHELRTILAKIHLHSKSRMARDLAGALKDLVDETFSGIFTNANEDTAWLSNRALAALVSGASFTSTDIADGNTTVFVCIPLKALSSRRRSAVSSSAPSSTRPTKPTATSTVACSSCSTRRRGSDRWGLLYQSIGQIIEQWGAEGKRAWYENASWRAYVTVKDEETAKELAATIGEYGVLAWSEGQNTGTRSKGFEIG